MKKVNSKFIEDIKGKRDGKFLESTKWCVKILFLMFPKTENNSTSFPSLILDFKGFPKKPIEDPFFKKISVRNLNKEVLQEKNPTENNKFNCKTDPLFEQTNKLLTLTKEKCKEKTITLKLQSFTKQNLTKTFTKQNLTKTFTKQNLTKTFTKQSPERNNLTKTFIKPNNNGDKVRFAVGQPRIYLIFKCGISNPLRGFLQLQPFSLFNYLSSISNQSPNRTKLSFPFNYVFSITTRPLIFFWCFILIFPSLISNFCSCFRENLENYKFEGKCLIKV